MGCYNNMVDEDEKGDKEESPAFNMMVLPNAELSACGWSFFFSCSHLNQQCRVTFYKRELLIFKAGLKGLSASSSLAARLTVCR